MGGFPEQPWFFPTKTDHFGVEIGVPPFKETPKWVAIIYSNFMKGTCFLTFMISTGFSSVGRQDPRCRTCKFF